MTKAQVKKIEKEAAQELEKVQSEIAAIEAANIWNDEIDNKYYNLWLAWNQNEILKLGGSLRSYNVR